MPRVILAVSVAWALCASARERLEPAARASVADSFAVGQSGAAAARTSVDSAAVLPTKAADAASVAPDSVAASGAACAVAVTAQPVAASASTRAVSVQVQPASAAVSSPRVEVDVIDLLLSSGEFASRLGVIRRLIQLRRARGEDESDLRALVTRILSGSR